MIGDRRSVLTLRQCGRIATFAPRSQSCLSRVHDEHAVGLPLEVSGGGDNMTPAVQRLMRIDLRDSDRLKS